LSENLSIQIVSGLEIDHGSNTAFRVIGKYLQKGLYGPKLNLTSRHCPLVGLTGTMNGQSKAVPSVELGEFYEGNIKALIDQPITVSLPRSVLRGALEAPMDSSPVRWPPNNDPEKACMAQSCTAN
jgi:hypothetical protein